MGVLFAVLDADNQAAAAVAAWWVGAAITVALVAWVAFRLRALRRQRRAQEGARVRGRLRAAGFQAVPGAADEEWQHITAEMGDR